MNEIYYILFGIIIGFALAKFFVLNKRKKQYKALEVQNTKRTEEKEIRKQKIVESLKEKEKITNNEVEKMLGVSDATATNYLEELERDGKIIQQGKTGRAVFYTLK